MAIVAFPAGIRAPKVYEIRKVANTQTQRSPFDGAVQSLAYPGARWRASIMWPNLPGDQWGALSAFLNSLEGRAGRFTYGPPLPYRRATTSIPGSVLVKGAGQTGTSLIIDGLPISSVVFQAGDWISYLNAASRPQLHQVVSTVSSNGSGEATLTITPPLRGSPADNVAITFTAPLAVWMLADDEQGGVTLDADRPTRGDIAIDIEEALA